MQKWSGSTPERNILIDLKQNLNWIILCFFTSLLFQGIYKRLQLCWTSMATAYDSDIIVL